MNGVMAGVYKLKWNVLSEASFYMLYSFNVNSAFK